MYFFFQCFADIHSGSKELFFFFKNFSSESKTPWESVKLIIVKPATASGFFASSLHRMLSQANYCMGYATIILRNFLMNDQNTGKYNLLNTTSYSRNFVFN